ALLEAGLGRSSLRKVLCGGEALPPELARRLLGLGASVYNMYGPTETTVWSACHRIPLDLGELPGIEACPIGRPLPGTQMYLLDGQGQPVPFGVPGELYIGGAGLALQYLNRPALTAERFVPDPFAGRPGARLYRTGDLARLRSDGIIEFIGRTDQQVKLRGYRIELGEIEATLSQHPALQASAVVCRPGRLEEKELIAYFVPDPVAAAAASEQGALAQQRTSEWQKIWDETYAQEKASESEQELAGWQSSYTGQALPEAQMRDWIAQTTARLLSLRPRRVLEVGCGTGLILRQLLPHVESYLATDASSVVLERLAASLPGEATERVRLACVAAAELATLGEHGFDVIVLNSVVQYFPSFEYLRQVLEQAVALLAPGGALFIGDVRSLPLLWAQHASVQLFRAGAALTRAEVRAAVERQLASERELALHPQAFALLAEQMGVAVELQVKRGHADNEMSRFRYDVVLCSSEGAAPDAAGAAPASSAPASSVAEFLTTLHIDARTLGSSPLPEIERRLRAAPEVVRIVDVVNGRVAEAVRIARWLEGVGEEATAGELRRSLASESSPGVDPDELWRLAEALGYSVEIAWSLSDPEARFDALLRRGAPASPAQRAASGWLRGYATEASPLASDPLAMRTERALVDSLRAHLASRLPAYMLPAQWVRLSALPLTPNGKVDRRALRAPERAYHADVDVEPRTEDERRLAQIWAEALRLERVGVRSDFFQLGGHSLLATQVVSRIRDAFQVELPLRTLFEARTIEALARELASGEHLPAPLPVAEPLRGAGPVPLSFSQQRLWFLDRLEGPSATYNLSGCLRLQGTLDVAALERALGAIAERHSVLRMRFVELDGRASQLTSDDAWGPLERAHLPGDSLALRLAEASAFATRVAGLPFDLARGPLLRAALAELDATDHVLVIAVHHIVADEWSIRIFLRELGQLYAAFVRGEPSPLPPLRRQYADYALWQRGWLDGPIRARQLEHWRTRLAGAPGSLALRTDYPRPATQSFRGRSFGFELGAALTARLRELGQRHGSTLFQTLLTGFAALLARHTGEQDLVLGTPIANRTRLEFEPLIGFFVNTLALRIDTSGAPSVVELLARVRAVCLDAQEHQDVPFEAVVEALNVQRDLSRAPLFQVLFVLQNAPLSELELGPVSVTEFPLELGSARFDLTLALEEQGPGAGLRGSFEYATELFEASSIARLCEHWLLLLEGLVARPDVAVSQLPILRTSERERLLQLAAEPVPPAPASLPPGPLTIPELLERVVLRTPQADAFVSASGTLSYAELARRVQPISSQLAAAGVRRGMLVGLYLEEPLEQLLGLLALSRVGAAYLPLDPRHPVARITFMLDDARAPFVLTQRTFAGQLSAASARILCLDLDSSLTAAPCVPAVEIAFEPPQPSDLAYALYTSGSTGQPKGIGVSHRAIVRLAQAQCELYGVDGASRILQLVSSGFDVAVSDVVMALASGAALIGCAPEARALEPLAAQLAEQRVTHLQLPASLLAGLPWRALPLLRALIVGGESSAPGLLERWRAGRRLFNAYGPTEATVAASAGESLVTDTSVHIGRPLAGARLYLLDGHLQLVPLGVEGELYIGGEQLAQGYLHRPALSAERFLPDPYASAPGRRMYRTGDRARYLPDGRLEFLGRSDQQIKLHGNRIELGEIEAALSSHPQVSACAVLLRELRPGEPRLCAVLSLSAPDAVSGEELARFLQERLPLAMVPSVFLPLPALPLTPNGKLDRQALAALDVAALVAERTAELSLPARSTSLGSLPSLQLPRTAAELALAEIWQGLLGVPQVNTSDNFFSLGGDSIISIQVVSRARQAGLELTVKQLFQHQTLAELAAVARTALPARAPQQVAPGPLPLTPIQRWFFEACPRNPHHFNQSLFLTATGRLDERVLGEALGQLARQHDLLRARFEPREGAWHAELSDVAQALPLTLEDLSGHEGELRAAIEASAATWQASLQLSCGPIGRVILYRCGGTEPDRLLLVLHHLVVDAVSWRILGEDLQRAYLACARGEAVTLGDKTSSFRAWAERLESHAASEGVVAELAYWQEVGAAHAALPRDAAMLTEPRTGEAATLTRTLAASTTERLLQETPRAYRTQINDVLLAALGRSLARVWGVRGLRIDLEGHGREELFEELDVSRTVGWFTTIFPVLLVANADEPLAQSITASKEWLRRVPRHGIHHGLLRYLAPEATRSRLAQVAPAELTFNYLGRFATDPSSSLFAREADEAPGPSFDPGERRRYLLELNAWVSAGALTLSLTYSPAIHRKATVERLADSLAGELEAIVAHCASPGAGSYTASDFPLVQLSAATLEQLTARFGRDVEDAYPLSPVQQGMLFHSQYAPASGAYCQQLVAPLAGQLEPAALRGAFVAVLQRHPALRSAFLQDADEPLQVVLSALELPWQELELRALPGAEQRPALEAWLEADRQRGFELARAPLLRLTLVRLASGPELVLTHHHLLLDGWSLAIVLGEALHAYAAILRRQPVQLPQPRPFRDYIAWLGERESSEAYWRGALAGVRATTYLGIEKAASGAATAVDFGERRLRLSATRTERLRALARQAQVTLGVVVQAAWSVLLARYSGERDVVFGATVSGRPAVLAGVEAMVGLFITTVPVHESPSPRLGVLEYLSGVQARQVAREPHVHSALVDIKSWSELPAAAPLFSTLLVFENYPAATDAPAEQSPLRAGDVRAIERTNYPFTLFVDPGDDLGLLASYDRSCHDDVRIEGLLAHLAALLEAMADNPSSPLAQLSMLSLSERSALLAASRRSGRDYSPEPLVQRAVQAQALRSPEALAVTQGKRKLTYAQLDRRARALAAQLGELGVGRDVIVGLYLERSVELVIALLAVLHAGGTYLPLDTEFPAERIGFMLQDSGARWVLTQARLTAQLPTQIPTSGAELRCLTIGGDFDLELEAEPRAPVAGSEPSPIDAAYVLYTSGSTGRPKGVTISHAALRNFLCSMREAPGLHAEDVLLSVTTISFDIAGLELLLPLLVGARVEILPAGAARDGSQIVAALRDSRATVLQATPSTWRLLLEQEWRGVRLARALCGGEALPRALADGLLARGVELWNVYGPTETTIWSTRQRVEPAEWAAADTTCRIGQPIANTALYLLDPQLEQVPAGVVGELCIGGAGVARGYLRRPSLTAERFLPDPFSVEPGARMYRTGDRVRYDERGELEFLGRMDHQIKLRGHRIELGEIEAGLLAHPAIVAAAVVLHGSGEDAELLSYLVARHGVELSQRELRAWLEQRLPSYMAVCRPIWLSALPLTLNGKVDRARLPRIDALAASGVGGQRQHAPSRTPTEQRLLQIWKEVLSVEELGVEDDFFQIGGHSLRATRVVARVRAAFDLSLPLAYLFDHPTIAELASEIDRRLAAAAPRPELGDDEEEVVL
ncbi:MAG: hypothetical protein RL033_3280, partial [Pseudomonadota bacterium]